MTWAAENRPSTASRRVATAEPADRESARVLQVQPGSPVKLLERIRLADKRPVLFAVEAIPQPPGPHKIALLDDEHQHLYWLCVALTKEAR